MKTFLILLLFGVEWADLKPGDPIPVELLMSDKPVPPVPKRARATKPKPKPTPAPAPKPEDDLVGEIEQLIRAGSKGVMTESEQTDLRVLAWLLRDYRAAEAAGDTAKAQALLKRMTPYVHRSEEVATNGPQRKIEHRERQQQAAEDARHREQIRQRERQHRELMKQQQRQHNDLMNRLYLEQQRRRYR